MADELPPRQNEIITGDCLSVMSQLAEDSIDLVVTSPPYDNLRDYNGYEWSAWDVACDLYRIVKPGGVVVWITNDATVKGSETLSSFEAALYFREAGFKVHDTMIWLKPHFANPSTNRCHQVFEYMFVFSKGKPKTFNPIRDVPIKYGRPAGKTSLRHKNGDITNTSTVRQSIGVFGARSNVWKINTAGQENFGKKVLHPAQFSERLAGDHILTWSNEADLVLDPFNGSGTTTAMAKKLDRRYIGIDISEEYCEMARRRLEQGVVSPRQISLLQSMSS